MRIIPKIDGTVDRFDRAALMTTPFDIAFATPEIEGGLRAQVLINASLLCNMAIGPSLVVMPDISSSLRCVVEVG